MNGKTILSVIIPVYGVEKYIEKCARSLFDQSLTEGIEFIFINDSTQDNSIHILYSVIEKYPQRQHQVKVVNHIINKGLPQSRLTGLLNAQGEYVIFCDSDDWVEPKMFEILLSKIIEHDTDIIICNFKEIHRDIIRYPQFSYSRKDILEQLLMKKIPCCIWNKMIRRTLFFNPDVIFPTENMGEDMVICSQLFAKTKRVTIIDNYLYNYRYNNNSISFSPSIENALNRFVQLKKNTELTFSLLDNYINPIPNHILLTRRLFVKFELLNYLNIKSVRKLYDNTYKECGSQFIFNNRIPFKSRLLFLLSILHLNVVFSRFRQYIKNINIK